MKKTLQLAVALLAGTTLLFAAIPASSANVDINIGIPGVYLPPPPVYVQQRPVIVQTQPVYVEQDDRYWDCKHDKCKHKKYKKEKHHKHNHDRDDD